MEGSWHYEKAERLLARTDRGDLSAAQALSIGTCAQVHATLALAYAQSVANTIADGTPEHYYTGIDTTAPKGTP